MKKVAYILLIAIVCFGVSSCGNSKKDVSALGLLTAFKNADLPVVDEEEVTSETDKNNSVGRPGECVEKYFFNDERISDSELSQSSIIEVFKNAKEMKAKRDFYQEAAETLNIAAVKYYTYSTGNILLRISPSATPEIAAEYEEILIEYAK